MGFLEWTKAKVQLLPTSLAQGEDAGDYGAMGSRIGKKSLDMELEIHISM